MKPWKCGRRTWACEPQQEWRSCEKKSYKSLKIWIPVRESKGIHERSAKNQKTESCSLNWYLKSIHDQWFIMANFQRFVAVASSKMLIISYSKFVLVASSDFGFSTVVKRKYKVLSSSSKWLYSIFIQTLFLPSFFAAIKRCVPQKQVISRRHHHGEKHHIVSITVHRASSVLNRFIYI